LPERDPDPFALRKVDRLVLKTMAGAPLKAQVSRRQSRIFRQRIEESPRRPFHLSCVGRPPGAAQSLRPAFAGGDR